MDQQGIIYGQPSVALDRGDQEALAQALTSKQVKCSPFDVNPNMTDYNRAHPVLFSDLTQEVLHDKKG